MTAIEKFKQTLKESVNNKFPYESIEERKRQLKKDQKEINEITKAAEKGNHEKRIAEAYALIADEILMLRVKVEKQEKQIERMKCCENCEYISDCMSNSFPEDTVEVNWRTFCSKWEIEK